MSRGLAERWRSALCAALISGALAGAALGAPVTPPPGARLTYESTATEASYRLPVGPAGDEEGDGPAIEEARGRVLRQAFRIDAEDTSTTGIAEEMRTRIHAAGFDEVFACIGEDCGGLAFRFGIEVIDPPAMVADGLDIAQISARRESHGGTISLSVLISRALSRVYLQIVTVGAPDADWTPRAEASAERVLPTVAPADERVSTERPPEAPAEAAPRPDARAIVARLRSTGAAELERIDFDPGGASVAASSSAALDRVANALKAAGDIGVIVVGHTDNQGSLEVNRTISLRRAQAVRRALIDRGIAAARLSAEGIAFLAPATSNATEEGRARNRRVVLVLR